jgi:hypothetical protein
MQLKALIDVVQVFADQSVAFRGWDESVGSTNCENFLEILDMVVSYNEKNCSNVIATAPKKCFLPITNDTKRNFICFFNQSEEGNS